MVLKCTECNKHGSLALVGVTRCYIELSGATFQCWKEKVVILLDFCADIFEMRFVSIWLQWYAKRNHIIGRKLIINGFCMRKKTPGLMVKH